MPAWNGIRDVLVLPVGGLLLLGVLLGPPALAAGVVEEVTGWGYPLSLSAGVLAWGLVGLRFLARGGTSLEDRLRITPCGRCGRRPGPGATPRRHGVHLRLVCPHCGEVRLERAL